MFYDNYKFSRYSVISETASDDLLDADVDETTKDVVEELEDELTTNIEEVPAEDKETNNAVLSPEDLKESCTLVRSNTRSGRVYMDIRDLMRICEAEEAETGAPPDAGDVAEDVADKNGVDSDNLVIVAPAEVAEDIIENALLEAKHAKSKKKKGKKASKKNRRKAANMLDALKDLKKKGFKVARTK